MKFNVQFNGIPEYKFDLINIKNKKKVRRCNTTTSHPLSIFYVGVHVNSVISEISQFQNIVNGLMIWPIKQPNKSLSGSLGHLRA